MGVPGIGAPVGADAPTGVEGVVAVCRFVAGVPCLGAGAPLDDCFGRGRAPFWLL